MLGVEYAATEGGPATINNVMPGSGAAEAGLRPGDVIVAVGGTEVRDSTTVKRIAEKTKPGDTLSMRVRRGEEERDVAVRLISFEHFVELDIARRGAVPATVDTAPAATAPSVTP
jgi:S1-C subfamily serine protease